MTSLQEPNAAPGSGGLPEQRSFIEEARRKQIIACTIDALAEVGFARTSLAEIARRAGISKGVISYHFAGKRELIEQVISQVYADEAAYMGSIRDSSGGAMDKLRAYIQGNAEFIKTQRKFLRAIIEIFLNYRKEDGTSFYDGSYEEPVIATLADILREGQTRGELGAFEPRVVAVSLKGAVDALPVQLSLHPDLDIDEYAAEVIALFERATSRHVPAEDR